MMKRFFVITIVALLAIACSSEPQKQSVTSQAENYTKQMTELLNSTIDSEALAAAGGPEKWYMSLDEAGRAEVADKCKKFVEIEKEFTAWRTGLNGEQKAEYQEYVKTGVVRNDMRKVTLMHRLMRIAAPRK